jgi:predicted N-acetyltransferase YhbS
MLKIEMAPGSFDDWDALLQLVHGAFSYMEGRIDPPSSIRQLDRCAIEKKGADETLITAYDGNKLVGCCFLKEMEAKYYLGKMAIDPSRQGTGVGNRLLRFILDFSRAAGKKQLELESRVELVEVHAFFRKFGFVQTATSAHEGFDRPTSITLQLDL